ncbi:MHYT domain-containing protein [Piscinibacter gummiphilus]|uniref:histidine kinase n=1 Tax=Piscinibacter gummiphilus TaxID=946333 RepID=A0ABZ0CM01_9BURK|nr:MHYT domain-containing protein [Piscinibacter gummiphilus]WOB06004.1 MHYT domain-containing protein [Piscinibacter gummiphilus]
MLIGYYETPLVLLSVLVAILASYTALSLAERVSRTQGRVARWWIAGGAFAMGTGIWAMHFVGMLAFRLPIALGFDLGITLLSWLLPIAVSAVALWQLGGPSLSWPALARSAGLLGIGITAMHYVGMAAMRMQPAIVYDLALVAASAGIAIAAAAAALWIGFRLRASASPQVWMYRAAASVVMGFAIVGMHYTGMAAASFPDNSICGAATGEFTLTQLATVVVVATVGVLAIALLTTVYDARLEARTAVLALAEQTGKERQQMLERERALRLEAERLSALKDEFLATLSHELRTPLNAVLGWAQILRTRHDEELLKKGVDTIERNARLQARLIDDLLDMSRIVSGRVRLEPELIEPWTVVEAAVEAVRPAMVSKQIELSADLDRASGRVWADPSRLQQVMWNLLSNASKFTPAQGRVRVELCAERRDIVVRVTDSGIGISPDFLPHMFERFRQADASTTRRQGGLGLGLAICRQLVELHGGVVEVASDGPGKGTTFTVRLPRASALTPLRGFTRASDADPSSREATPPQEDLTGATVLVVDDETDARLLLQQILGDRGARVMVADSARAALEALGRETPHVMVSDIGMPDVDGFELIRRVRAHPDPGVASVKAVALTAFTRSEDHAKALREGFDAFLPKPVEAGMLVSQVARLAGANQPHCPT